MMKIIFINRFFYPDHSATSQMLSDLAFFLSAQGYDVSVLTSRQGYDAVNQVLPAIDHVHGVTVQRVWSPGFGRHFLFGRALDYIAFYLLAGWRLWQRANPDTVVIPKTDPPMLSVMVTTVARFRHARQINWLQDLFPEVAIALGVRGIGGWFGTWLGRIRNSSLRSADMNVVIGEKMRDRLLDEGIPEEQVLLIPNWADDEAIKPQANDNSQTRHGKVGDDTLRKAWGLAGKFIVGYSGNLGRAHEFTTLLDAATQLRNHQDIMFLCIGGGAGMTRLQEQVGERQLTNVLFKSYQPRVMLDQSLGVADVHLVILRPELEGLIVPSKFYGIAAAGKPTLFIGDNAGEIARLLVENRIGLTVKTGKANELVKTILAFKSQPELGRDMGARARRLFEQEFTASKAFAKWQVLLKSMDNKMGA